MATLLDMLWPSNPISGTNAAPRYNPYQTQYQMAQTPQQVNGQPNPQYQQLQDQYQQALKQQRTDALSNTLLSAGAGMLGAVDRYGNAASFGPALAQGIQSGIAGRNAYTQNANQQAEMQLRATQAGQQAALGQQQMQLNQMELEEKEKLNKQYGFSSLDMIKLSLAHTDNQTKLLALANIAMDSKSSPDQRQRALAAYNMFKGSPEPINGPQVLNMIYPKPMDPELKESLLEQRRTSAEARNATLGLEQQRLEESKQAAQERAATAQETAGRNAEVAMNRGAEAAWTNRSRTLGSYVGAGKGAESNHEAFTALWKFKHAAEFPGTTPDQIKALGDHFGKDPRTNKLVYLNDDGTTTPLE